MASNGFHDVVRDLRCRLNVSEGFLSTASPTVTSGSVPHELSFPDNVFNHRSDYRGERIFSVNWVFGDSPAPFEAGSVLKFLYCDKCVSLADADDNIRFVKSMTAKEVTILLNCLEQNSIKVLWTENRNLLQFDITGDFRPGFVSISPVKLSRRYNGAGQPIPL
jgi:hypothetical protein